MPFNLRGVVSLNAKPYKLLPGGDCTVNGLHGGDVVARHEQIALEMPGTRETRRQLQDVLPHGQPSG